ncbi:MAG: hypothetical protein LBH11_04965 [Propionibacteriaceae bacterium]|jgi:hypothetical protein|nr:hypothetical protein [Propionibacteriaceae bacterium]
MEAPFSFGRVSPPIDFCDREAERGVLARNFMSGTNTTLISPRRWGKTSLVAAVARDLSATKGLAICRIDLLGVRDEADCYAALANGVIAAVNTGWDGFVSDVKRFLSQLRPRIAVSPDPSVQLSFDLDWEEVGRSPADVIDLAQRVAAERKLKLVVCVDEFQAIAGFKDSLAFQQALRARWQHHSDVTYCLYGSKRSMMTTMFSDPAWPFYRFGEIMELQKIANSKWSEFIAKRFDDTGKAISVELASYLAELVDNHPYYVQQLAQQTWYRTGRVCAKPVIDEALGAIADQLGYSFTSLAEGLSAAQLRLIQAVLNGANQLSSAATIKEYRLKTAGSVVAIKKALISKEVLDADATGKLSVLDPVFAYWLKNRYFAAS